MMPSQSGIQHFKLHCHSKYLLSSLHEDGQRCVILDTRRNTLHIIDFEHNSNERVRIGVGAAVITAISFHRQLIKTLVLGDDTGNVSLFNYDTQRYLPANICCTYPISQFGWLSTSSDETAADLLIISPPNVHLVHSTTLGPKRKISQQYTDHNFRQYFSALGKLYGISDQHVAYVVWPTGGPICVPAMAYEPLEMKQEFLNSSSISTIRSCERLQTTVDAKSDGLVVNNVDAFCGRYNLNGADNNQQDSLVMTVCTDDGILLLSYRHRNAIERLNWDANRFVRLCGVRQHIRCSIIPHPTKVMLCVCTDIGVFAVDVASDCMLLLLPLSRNHSDFRATEVLVSASRVIVQYDTATTDDDGSHDKVHHCTTNVYNISVVLADLKEVAQTVAHHQLTAAQRNSTICALHKRLSRLLPRDRLVRHLSTFSEYPAQGRAQIWHRVLRLPRAVDAFERLRGKGRHPKVDAMLTDSCLADEDEHRQLRRCVSALLHWCEELGELGWLPRFVYPFLHVFESDVQATFETVATLLLNHGRLWPDIRTTTQKSPAANFLTTCDQLLRHFVPRVHTAYAEHAIRPARWAGTWLLHSAGSEVLEADRWLRLWDNVCSRPAWWLPLAVVAIHKLTMRCAPSTGDETSSQRRPTSKRVADEMWRRFADQAMHVDVGRVAALADRWADECPQKLHPEQYFGAFRSLAAVAGDEYERMEGCRGCVADEMASDANSGGGSESTTVARRLNDGLLEMDRLFESMESMLTNAADSSI